MPVVCIVSVYSGRMCVHMCVCAVINLTEVTIFLNHSLCVCEYRCVGMGQDAALSRMDLLLKFEQF